MPHLVIEYSENMSGEFISSGVLESLHETMISCGLFSPDAIKTRAYSAADFMVGTKGKNGKFVHVSVSILSGRTAEQRLTLNQSLVDIMRNKLIGINSITVEIREMDKETYQKTSTT
jgi:5-carboxymethyl-2-hydroxymuconate isomerase